MPRHLKKIAISCFAGNMLEWYEFAVFGFLTTYISQNFFPTSSPYLATLMTYAIFATGFIMRPLGAILSGHIGDRQGRRGGLLLSITLMALPTFAIGCLPTYEQIGILAPILLLLCRMIQGISLGGEFSGSIVYLIEHSPKDRPGFYASWADLGSSVGMIAASLTSLVLTLYLSQNQMLSFGWRLPFLGGIAFGLLGYYLRRDLAETPEFKATTEKKPGVP
ncbi:MFS transporter [Candidatus Odyssella acanthamoebae]|uniref:MFS transporter n=1 Tax=Candidatus Odyssella acanthamoebae TaxID=91604 RepID=UPI00068B2C19|nr:MFS transporter [Candidatus Paracaedibacter acanthamoebae]